MSEEIGKLFTAVQVARERFYDAVVSLGGVAPVASLGAGRWTAGQYTEHVVRAEEVTIWRMWSIVDEKLLGGEFETSETPELSIEEIVERTWKPQEQAPPLAIPSLGGSSAYWLERLLGNRYLLGTFADCIEVEDLDEMAYRHPISGLLTFRQGMQFIRFHLERHCAHVVEIREAIGWVDPYHGESTLQ